MPLPTAASIASDYPVDFINEPPARITRFIEIARTKLVETQWQPQLYPIAVTYLACHLLALSPSSDPSAPIDGIPVDPERIKSVEVFEEYTIAMHSPKDMGIEIADGTLTATKWGRLFLDLKQSNTREFASNVAFGRGARSRFDQPIW